MPCLKGWELNTWKNLRRGLGGPLFAYPGWQVDWFQATLPSLPALTLKPATRSWKHHKSGFFCHKTKSPTSQFLLSCTLSQPACISEPFTFIRPIAHMLVAELNAKCPPLAATNCCTIYFALEDSYKKYWTASLIVLVFIPWKIWRRAMCFLLTMGQCLRGDGSV